MLGPAHEETFGRLEWDPLLNCWLGGIDWPPGLHTEVAIWLPDSDLAVGLRQAREGLAWSSGTRRTPAVALPARCWEDPAWELHLEERACWKWTHTLARQGRIDYLWKEQGGKCVVCGQPLQVEAEAWHVHHRVWRGHGGQDTFDNLELLHANCHRQIHARTKD